MAVSSIGAADAVLVLALHMGPLTEALATIGAGVYYLMGAALNRR